MSLEERNAWVMLVVAPVGYVVYLSWMLREGAGGALEVVEYRPAMLWTIGGAIVASIVINIVFGMFFPFGKTIKDQRDREIYRLGEYTGQSFVVIGGLVGLVLAMLRVDTFWIANAIYLCFVLSALLGSLAKIGLYRFGFHP
jgi:hypothetical protein